MACYFGFNGIWGYDPGVLSDMRKLITFSQGGDPSAATQNVLFSRASPNIFAALRCGLIFTGDTRQPIVAPAAHASVGEPRAQLSN